MTKTNIVWIRRDLQIHDNASIHKALREGKKFQPVFIFDSEILKRFSNKQDRRLSFLARTVAMLNEQFKQAGGKLLVLYGNPLEIIPKLAEQLGGKVFAGEDYEPSTIARDEAVGKQCELELSLQHLMLSPNAVLKDDGTPFKVFTPYSKKWRVTLTEADELEFENDIAGKVANIDFEGALDASDPKSLLAQIGYELVEDEIWQPEKALDVLREFAKNRLDEYGKKRDFPAVDGVSAISPYLRFGLVTIRQCCNAAKGNEKAFKWVSELIWREFYAMILYHFPRTVNEEFMEKYRGLEWWSDEDGLQKWKEGKTGFTIVDAGMRQLLQDGWMHNRVRMIVASFLTKDLLIDWRKGEEHFAQYLMDYEQASNVGGWQWAASTGTDAAPYFRIFNPHSQAKKFDPDGEYIKKYIPELRDLPKEEIHQPSALMRGDYPQEMVNHHEMREKILAFFKVEDAN